MSQPAYLHRIETARSGTNPAVIFRVPCGWVFLSNLQFLRGYCVLQSDPTVESINSLGPRQRAAYLGDMVLVGDAILAMVSTSRRSVWHSGFRILAAWSGP